MVRVSKLDVTPEDHLHIRAFLQQANLQHELVWHPHIISIEKGEQRVGCKPHPMIACRAGSLIGLADKLQPTVTDRGDLENWTMQVAQDICKSSPVAVRQAKEAIDAALGVPIEDGIEREHDAWRRTITSEDREEGIGAFTEKRDPQWKNQ